MRSLLNILIMAFVVGAVWFQFKQGNIPALTNYFKNSDSSLQSIKVPNSVKAMFAPLTDLVNGKSINLKSLTNLNSLGSVGLNTLTNLVTPPGSADTGSQIPLPTISLPKIELPTAKPTPKTSISTDMETVITTQSSPGALTNQGIVNETNKARTQYGAGNLIESSKLDASAKVKAEDILKRQYFAHIDPSGKSVSNLVANEGYTYLKIGENLALGSFKDDNDVVTAWMNSPGHKANIIDPAFTEIGIGIAYGMYQGREVSVAVQHFGRPRSSCPEIDESLRKQVEVGQKELDTMSASLTQMKAEIDQGRAEGRDMTATIMVYNNGVDQYHANYTNVDTLRIKYNAEVNAFNACLGSAN